MRKTEVETERTANAATVSSGCVTDSLLYRASIDTHGEVQQLGDEALLESVAFKFVEDLDSRNWKLLR